MEGRLIGEKTVFDCSSLGSGPAVEKSLPDTAEVTASADLASARIVDLMPNLMIAAIM
jgi:hypothetical protein